MQWEREYNTFNICPDFLLSAPANRQIVLRDILIGICCVCSYLGTNGPLASR